MVSSYTANLAAFLTIESLSSPISNVEDLANAGGAVPYGAKRGGSTFGFFKVRKKIRIDSKLFRRIRHE